VTFRSILQLPRQGGFYCRSANASLLTKVYSLTNSQFGTLGKRVR
jgi:hypothetical protein